jgi:hypothetical protein
MYVTPVNRKFGRHVPGDTFRLPDAVAKVFIKKGRLAEAKADAPAKPQSYMTRDLRAAPAPVVVETRVSETPVEDVAEEAPEESVESVEEAPYGYKADGTPRKRPGRPAASE